MSRPLLCRLGLHKWLPKRFFVETGDRRVCGRPGCSAAEIADVQPMFNEVMWIPEKEACAHDD